MLIRLGLALFVLGALMERRRSHRSSLMEAYRKLIAALLGVAAMVLATKFGVNVPGLESGGTEIIISALTALGVFAAPNAQKA